jgi:peptidyl-prolyl cis-trans isomerase D
MLTAFRNFAQTWPARILMAVLAVSFLGWGASKVGFSGIRGDAVVRAGSRVVTSGEFRRIYENDKKEYEQRSGQQLTPEIAAAQHVDRAVLNQVSLREAFLEAISKLGIVPSDKLIADQISKIPAFFDPVSGRFDKKTFVNRLAENGLTPAAFDREIRDQMAAQHFVVGLTNGLEAPRAYGALAAVLGLETRDIAYFQVTPQMVGQPPAPTDAQLSAFLKEQAAQFTRPEMRTLTIVSFTPDPSAATGPIDPAELQKRYNFRKDTFSKPETRTIVQIPAKTAAAAQQIQAALGKGEAADAIAKAQGVEAITYTDKPQSALPDHKLAQQAFAMQAGQTSTIQGDLGLAVVNVVSVTPGRTVTLEEARPMLEAEIRKDMATEKVYTATQAYDDAHQAGQSMAQAAQKAGVTPVTVGPVTQQGVDANGQPAQGLNPRILEEAFQLPAGGESELIEGEGGAYFAVKVDKVQPAALPALSEIRTVLSKQWTQQQLAQRMQAKAKELTERVQKGEKLDAVAASAGASVVHAQGLSRRTAAQDPTHPREVLGRAFGAKAGEVFSTPTQAFTIAVGQVSNIQMQAGPEAAQIAENQRGQMNQMLAGELLESAQRGAREKVKVVTDPARARAAIGLEPEEAPAAAGKKK